ncbi:MAG: hypothetical protein ABI718_01080 [Acidobacteriota bacterium]
MSLPRFLAILFLICAVVFAGVLTAGYFVFVRPGFARITVSENFGDREVVHAFVPVGLVNFGIRALPFADFDIDACGRDELRTWKPALAAAVAALETAPDVTLLRVHSDDSDVVVRKENSEIRIEVTAPDARVRITLPPSTTRAFLGAIRDL